MSKEKHLYDYHGYTVDVEKGEIIRPNGNVVNVLRNNGCPCVKLSIDGKQKRIAPARVVYEVVYGKELEWGEKIVYKDGDDENFSISNIEVESRKLYGKNHTAVNMDKNRITEEDQQLIKAAVDCKRQMVDRWGVAAKRIHPNAEDLAILWDCSPSTIMQIANDTYNKR